MKFSCSILAALSLLCVSCKQSKIKEETLPQRKIRSSALEVSHELKGEWENCHTIPGTKKSLLTRLNIATSLEVREYVFNDEFCQEISSTKERSIFSDYDAEMDGIRMNLKIKNRKVNFYSKALADEANDKNFCTLRDWREKKPREVLNLECDDIGSINKGALSSVIVTSKDDYIKFGDLKFTARKEEVKYSDLPKIRNVTNSDIVSESEVSNIVLVYPPKTEKFLVQLTPLKVGDKAPLDCEPLIGLQQTATESAREVETQQKELKHLQDIVDASKKELDKRTEQLFKYIDDNNLGEYDEIEKEIAEVEESIDGANYEYKQCNSRCDEISKRLNDLKSKKRSLTDRSSKLNIPRKTIKVYDSLVSRVTSQEAVIGEGKLAVQDQQNIVNDALAEHEKIFAEASNSKRSYSGNLYYESMWSSNIRNLIKANPKYKFRMAVVDKVVMTYNLIGPKNYPAGESILSFPQVKPVSLVKGRFNLPNYPISFQGPTKVNLMAACPALDPAAFKILLTRPGLVEFEVSFQYKR